MLSLDTFRRLELGTNPGVISISGPEIEWLMNLAKTHQACRSLETGVGNGFSAVALLLAGVEEHTAVEFWPRNLDIAQTNIMKAKTPTQRFRLLFGSSDIRLAALVDAGEKFDLILIDGGHSYEDAFIDIHYARSLLDAGGVMVLDDTNWPAVRSAMNWHQRFLAHIWTEILPPAHLAGRPGFNMAAFRRSALYARQRPTIAKSP